VARDGDVWCPGCGGVGKIVVRQMLEDHDGRVRLAAVVGPMIRAGVAPTWWPYLPADKRSSLDTLCRNPCIECGTHLLEEEWVGSGYCSRRCCVANHRTNWEYARMVLEGVEERRG
jgi:hypothetical protein